MLAGDEEGIVRALADRQDATSMRIRADLAKGRHDLSQELVTREALCALPEAKAADEYALSLVLIKLGDFRHAVRILERMVTPDPETSVDKHLALGDALSGWARIDEARDSYGDAATLALERGDGVQVMTAALGLARLSFASGRRCFARAEAERVRDEAKSMNQDKLLIEAWTEISRAAFGTGDTREGIRAAYEAQAAALRANTSPLRPRLASVLSLAIELDGDVAQGKQLREDAREALRSKALQISDTEWRRCFLEHVPAHAELMMD